MDEQEAHDLYIHFSDVHAAAKSGRGLGFNVSKSTARTVDPQDRWQNDAHDLPQHVDSSKPEAVSQPERWAKAQSRDSEHETAPKRLSNRNTSEQDHQTRRHHASEHRHDEEQGRSDSKTSHSKRYRDEERHRRDRDYDDRDYKRRDSGGNHTDGDRHRRDRHSRSDREHCSSGHHDRRSSHQAHSDRESRDNRSREQQRSSKNSSQRVTDASMRAKKSNPDFEREIPGYAKMTPAERMKARTKLLLGRSTKQDLNEAKDGQWTRYVFNKDALLDEEGATPAGGFSGDANTVSLRLPQAQAETKQHMQTAEEAHEAAIFGKSSSAGLPGSRGQQDDPPSLHVGLGLGMSIGNSAVGRELDKYPEPASGRPAPTVSLVATDVLSAQPGVSWRERAALKKKQLSVE